MPNDFFSPIEWLLQTINRPVSAVAGTVLAARQDRSPIDAFLANLLGERQDSFGDVLLNEGMNPGAARAAGFGLDVVLDPLNVVPIAKVAKLSGVEKGAKALVNTKPVKAVTNALGEHLNPTHLLPADYAKQRRLLNSSLSSGRAQAVEDAVGRFKGTTPEERALISHALENPAALDAIQDPLRKQQLLDLTSAQKQAFSGMAEREVGAGVLKQEQVDKILREQGGYVPYIFEDVSTLEEVLGKPMRELSGKFKFAKERSLDSFKAAEELGATTDIARLSSIRQAAGDRSIKINKFLDDVFSNPEWAKPIEETRGLPGWRTISTNAENPVAERIRTMAVAPEIAPDLERLLSRKHTSAFMKGFDKLTNSWKAVATTMKPGFHARNLVSNAFNSWLGGMSPASMPKRYAEATAIVAGKIPARIGAHSGPELIEQMRNFGVLGREFGFVGDLGDTAELALKEGLMTPGQKVAEGVKTLGLKPWAKAGRAIGANVEDTSRVALFLDAVKKGATPEDAALHVKKYLFDYQELTDTERTVLRRFVPFYTWMRKNIPLQLEHLYKDTGKYSQIGSAYKETEGAAEDMGIGVATEDRPDFLRKLGAVQLPLTSNSGEKEFFNPNLPFQDLGKVMPTGENLQDQLASLHPIFKTLIERSMNQSIFKDRPLYRETPQEMVEAPMSAQLFAQTFPDLAKPLGIRLMKVDGEVKWKMPEWSSYILEQLPVFNTLGKAAVNIGDPNKAAPLHEGPLEGMTRPPALDFLMGTKFLPQSDQQLRRDRKFRREEQQRKAKLQRKERRQLLSDEEIEALLGGNP